MMGRLLLLFALLPLAAERVVAQTLVTAIVYGQTVSFIYTPPASGFAPSSPAATSAQATRAVSDVSVTPSDRAPVPVSIESETVVVRPSPPTSASPNPGTNLSAGAAAKTSSSLGRPAATQSTAAASRNDGSDGGGLSEATIIGLSVGLGILGLLILAALVWFLLSRRKKQTDAILKEYNNAGDDMSVHDEDLAAYRSSPAASPPDREPTLPIIATAVSDFPRQSVHADEQSTVTALPSMGLNQNSSPSPGSNAPWNPRSENNRYYLPSPGFDFGDDNSTRSGRSSRQQQFRIPRRPLPD